MATDTAQLRYLQRHIEADLPACPCAPGSWRQVLVIPAYREAADLLQRLRSLPVGTGKTLVILVLNRPDSDPDPQANADLRRTVAGPPLQQINPHTDLYVHDLEALRGPLPAAQGVGLARKTGCDIAFSWMAAGAIDGPWIHCTDADANLPGDYFRRLANADPRTVVAVYPFQHVPGPDPACNHATTLYELRLHQHVLGLEYAGSPYAYHSLGSCLAVRAAAYAQVRGFPRRSGGEDFYLLNKLTKVGSLLQLRGAGIELQSRDSRRVPFGTGPAVARISAERRPEELALFYHPAVFEALRGLLAAVPLLRDTAPAELAATLPGLLAAQGLKEQLARTCGDTAIALGLHDALIHCQRQGRSAEQFLRQFHQWLDGFRSLKFIHAVRAAGWPDQPFSAQGALWPRLWPGLAPAQEWDIASLGATAREHWGWLDN